MPDLSAYLGWDETNNFEAWYRQLNRADYVGFMLGHRGADLTLVRGNTALDAQRFLIAPAGRNTVANETKSDSGIATKEQLLLVALIDADIKRGDRFSYNASPSARLNYEVIRVERAIYGMLQCYAEEVQ